MYEILIDEYKNNQMSDDFKLYLNINVLNSLTPSPSAFNSLNYQPSFWQ